MPYAARGGEIGKALQIARAKPRMADGGATPWYVRSEARSMTHGPLNSGVAGRTDHLPINVGAGSHVIPADVVSGLGQGNTNAGMNVLGHMFSTGPYGMALGKMGGHAMRPPSLKFAKPAYADGGEVEAVPIMAAGGEYVIPPEHVAAVGGGNPELGHEIIDQFILDTRNKTIKTMRKLPGPVKE